MDINDLRGVSTILVMAAFIGVVFWAYSKKRKKTFDEAANLPFEDDELDQRSREEEEQHD